MEPVAPENVVVDPEGEHGAANGKPTLRPLAILAGGGALPIAVARQAAFDGRQVHIVAIVGECDEAIENFPHTWVRLGQARAMMDAINTNGPSDLVVIGSVSRPDIRNVRLDLAAIRKLPLLLSFMVGGDDALLTTAVRFFEGYGHRVVGAHEVAPDLLVQAGRIAGPNPRAHDHEDIAKGREVVKALGALDVGQAAVVARGYVLAVEAAEGTDAMLERCADLRQWGLHRWHKRRGVLVKMVKPGQDRRIDMPTLGPRTVELAQGAGLAGIAVEAGSVLVAQAERTREIADAAGLFVWGIAKDGEPAAGR